MAQRAPVFQSLGPEAVNLAATLTDAEYLYLVFRPAPGSTSPGVRRARLDYTDALRDSPEAALIAVCLASDFRGWGTLSIEVRLRTLGEATGRTASVMVYFATDDPEAGHDGGDDDDDGITVPPWVAGLLTDPERLEHLAMGIGRIVQVARTVAAPEAGAVDPRLEALAAQNRILQDQLGRALDLLEAAVRRPDAEATPVGGRAEPAPEPAPEPEPEPRAGGKRPRKRGTPGTGA